MSPDLNSLPPSRSTTASPSSQQNNPTAGSSESPHWSPHRLPSHNSRPSLSENRRRSGIGVHLNMNEPSGLPGAADVPSEHRSSVSHAFRNASPTSLAGSPTIATGDPHHQRAPSLGEIHQELEQEQEAQVNRLLQMIRQQQTQLQQMQLQMQQNSGAHSGTAIADDLTPGSERSASFPILPPLPTAPGRTSAQHSSFSTRRSSRTSNHQISPSLRPVPSGHSSLAEPPHGSDLPGPGASDVGTSLSARRNSRDESSFYQAEAAMLSRENQMLRARIRELERQINELKTESHAVNVSSTTQSSGNAGNDARGPTAPEDGSGSQADKP